MRHLLYLFLPILLICGCTQTHAPKPHGCLRIDMPQEHNYQNVDGPLPFSLAYSSIAQWNKLEASQKYRKNNLWYNIHYPKYHAKIHLSYIPLENNLDSLMEESREFVFEHTIKADAIDETLIHQPKKNIYGILYDLKGNTASNMEFVVTDSTTNFLRGALYLENTPNVDSLAPVIDYIKQDIIYLINSLEWTCH